MASPRLDAVLVMHFQAAGVVAMQVDEEDGIVAVSTFSAFIVLSHATEDDCEPVLVEDGRVVAAGPFTWDGFNPGVGEEGEDVDGAERGATVAPYQHSLVFVDDQTVPLPAFGLPTLDSDGLGVDIVGYIFGEGLLH